MSLFFLLCPLKTISFLFVSSMPVSSVHRTPVSSMPALGFAPAPGVSSTSVESAGIKDVGFLTSPVRNKISAMFKTRNGDMSMQATGDNGNNVGAAGTAQNVRDPNVARVLVPEFSDSAIAEVSADPVRQRTMPKRTSSSSTECTALDGLESSWGSSNGTASVRGRARSAMRGGSRPALQRRVSSVSAQ